MSDIKDVFDIKLIKYATTSIPAILVVGGIYILNSPNTPDHEVLGLVLIGLGFMAFVIEIGAYLEVKEMEVEKK